jgi:hypothetical protein
MNVRLLDLKTILTPKAQWDGMADAYEVIYHNAWPCICGCGKYWAGWQVWN